MIKIGDTYYRNLEEQVLKNKQDIADHYNVDRVLGEVGIKVIGQLDEPPTYQVGTDYGDAYAVGIEPPYRFYVWTRADIDSGHPEDYWLDIGQLAIVGPEGPQGETGPQGERGPRGSYWFASAAYDPEEYDWMVDRNGTVQRFVKDEYGNLNLEFYMNIKGPQGIQGERGPQGYTGPQGEPGPQGPRGDVGGFINIYGILRDRNELPDPSGLGNRSIAYLIGTGFPYDLYIQVGDADGPVTWVNSGPLNVSTLVFVNGEAQNVWDADTKLDKVTSNSSLQQVYVKNINGTQTMVNMSSSTVGSSLVQRQANSNILVPITPVDEGDATSKKYVEDNFTPIPAIGNSVPYFDSAKRAGYINVNKNSGEGAVPSAYTFGRYGVDGTWIVGSPLNGNHATNKDYVDDNFVLKSNLAPNEPKAWSIPQRTYNGRVLVGTPEESRDATTKAYVDGNFSGLYKHTMGIVSLIDTSPTAKTPEQFIEALKSTSTVASYYSGLNASQPRILDASTRLTTGTEIQIIYYNEVGFQMERTNVNFADLTDTVEKL